LKTKIWNVVFEEPGGWGANNEIDTYVVASNPLQAVVRARQQEKGFTHRRLQDIIKVELEAST